MAGPVGVAATATVLTLLPSTTGGGRAEWPIQGFDNLRFAKHGDELMAQVEYRDASGNWQKTSINVSPLVEHGEIKSYSIEADALAGALQDRGFAMPEVPEMSLLPGAPISAPKPTILVTPPVPALPTDESLSIQDLPPLDLTSPIPEQEGIQILESIWTDGELGSGVKNARKHWEEHRSEFPELNNALEYTNKAQDFYNNPPEGAFIRTRSHDGAAIIYDP